MSALDDPDLLTSPPARLRQPIFWMALLALMLLIIGLFAIALPDSISGPVVWTFSADHGLRWADMIGAALLVAGSDLIWMVGLVWQWLYTH